MTEILCVCVFHSVLWCASRYYSAEVTMGPCCRIHSVYLCVYILCSCFLFICACTHVYVRVGVCVCSGNGLLVPWGLVISALLPWDRTLDSFTLNKGARWGVSSHTNTCRSQCGAANTSVWCTLVCLTQTWCWLLKVSSSLNLMVFLSYSARTDLLHPRPSKHQRGFFLSPRSRKIIRSMLQLFSAGVQILLAATDWRLAALCKGWRTPAYEITKPSPSHSLPLAVVIATWVKSGPYTYKDRHPRTLAECESLRGCVFEGLVFLWITFKWKKRLNLSLDYSFNEYFMCDYQLTF